jgi:arsenate reductase
LRVVELWHNPSCSKSRAAKALLDEKGVAYLERHYLDDPPTPDELDRVLTALDLDPWKAARLEEPVAAELGMKAWPHDDRRRWIQAMVANPILIERPILVTDDGQARLGRPPEAVQALL